MANLGQMAYAAADPLIRQDNAGRAQASLSAFGTGQACAPKPYGTDIRAGLGFRTGSGETYGALQRQAKPYCDAAAADNANTTKERFYA